jgi:hypothetical protein
MKSNGVRSSLWMAATALLVATPALALDAPTVTLLQSKPSSARVLVTAGPSGAPAGFFVDRMEKSEFDALGGWPVEAPAVTRVIGSFTGTPTFNIEGTSPNYRLQSGQSIEVELGQLFDETGVGSSNYNELTPGTQYVIRIRANNVNGEAPSAFTETMVVSSGLLAANCTYTQGYWKNHPENWPVASLTLGTVNYTVAQLLFILGQPAQGNKLTILAHQLIAAKLNLANGASPVSIATTIANADALIGGLVVKPIGNGSLPASPATGYANTLDDFNNGLLGPGHCGTVPTTAQTWGHMKAIYRN